jgi:cold shock CspA family protein
MTTRQVGTVAKWLNHRGIGFITPQGEATEVGKDYLVHFSNIKQDDGDDSFKSLAEGGLVEFETAVDPKNSDKMIGKTLHDIRIHISKRREGVNFHHAHIRPTSLSP